MGGLQRTLFLTEQGLCKLLLISRKTIACPFQKWVDEKEQKMCLSRKGLPDKVAPGGKRVAKIHPRTSISVA
jgi:hypothetical protein